MPDKSDVPDLSMDEWGPRYAPTEPLLTEATLAFDLGTLIDASDLGGTYNLNALLHTSRGRYVLRVYRPWVTAERLSSIQQTKRALGREGIPVPQPLAMPTGETMLLHGQRLVEVEPFVTHDHSADNWDRYARAFALLGSLHDALAANLPSPFIPPRVSNYGTPPQLLRWLATTERKLQKENSSSVPKQALAACQEARDLLLTIDGWWQEAVSSLLIQPLHGDYGGGNILFQGDTIVAVLDFDFLSIRERVFELAYTTYWLFERLNPGAFPGASSWQKVADLLAIYNQSTMHPLMEQERKAFAFEMARVPLYWIAEAGFTPQPLQAVQAMIPNLPFSRWLLSHADEISERIKR